MTGRYIGGALIALAVAATPVAATSLANLAGSGTGGISYPPYLQCVPYARQVTGVRIFGDAHTWWGQAEGRYGRGSLPKVGAVMSFRASGSSHLGHVAAVSKIIDSRTVLISHSNWSPINGRRGQVEKNVRAVDVSPGNDWSEVRVWYGPIKALGGRHWPLNGFIYNEKPGKRGSAQARRSKIELAMADTAEASTGRKAIMATPADRPARAKTKPARAISPESDPIGAIIASTRR